MLKARWIAIWLCGLIVVCLIASLVLVTALHGFNDEARRLLRDFQRLRLSFDAPPGEDTVRRFNEIYGATIGRDADPRRIRAHFERELDDDGPMVLDSVMANYIVHRYGRIDARFLPPGLVCRRTWPRS